jgi:hypothetical protein
VTLGLQKRNFLARFLVMHLNVHKLGYVLIMYLPVKGNRFWFVSNVFCVCLFSVIAFQSF